MIDELAGLGIEARQLVVADDGNLDTAREFGFSVLRRDNVLGFRVNEGFEYACTEGGADFVAFAGSDDWHLASYFTELPEPDRVRTCRWVSFVSPDGTRLVSRRMTSPVGTAPWIIPRELLAAYDFRPAEDGAMSGVDHSISRGIVSAAAGIPNTKIARRRSPEGYARVLEYTFQHVDSEPLRVVDFKGGGEQITPWKRVVPSRQRWPAAGEPPPFGLLATRYPADLCDRMAGFYAARRAA